MAFFKGITRLAAGGGLSGAGVLLVAALAGTAAAEPGRYVHVEPPERRLLVRSADDGGLPSVRPDRRVVAATAERGSRFRVPNFPLRRDLEVTLELERFDVTSGSTRFVIGRKSAPDLGLAFDPASQLALYRGQVVGRPGSRVVLALRPGTHSGRIDLGPGQPQYWLSSRGERGQRLAAGRGTVFEGTAAPGLPPDVPFCGVHDSLAFTAPAASKVTPKSTPSPTVGLRHLELAVETDYEFFQLFGDPVEAAAYLVALYAQVSDIYLRDVDTRVELVFGRIWETPDDLFNEVDPSPLSEFRSVWNATMGGVQRDVAQLLSGRRDYPFGGQAYLSSMCGSFGYGVVGYALGAFPDPTQPSGFSYDISVTAHELGHNAGTGHTHDSPNLIDTCDDPLTTPQRGTIMSYCGQTWSGGNANRDLYFHSRIQQNMEAHLGSSSCVVDDCNLNGIDDASDISGGVSVDTNTNGVPDECEDCDGNGTLDPLDIALGAADVDANGTPDICEPDCNTNNVPDDEDIALSTSVDAYGNDIPDECETDCNTNTTSDYTEIQLDMTLDIDRNATLDSCQDCDNDTATDLVELAGAHDLWLASGLETTPLRRFHATSGVLAATSTGSTLDEAQDLLITPDSRVLVSSAHDHRVAEFDVAGNFVGDLVASGSGGLDHPTGLAIAPSGDLLVASRDTNEVLRYNLTTGVALGAFVSAGAGGLSAPFGLSIGPNGNLYVSDDNGSVIEYNGSTGALVGTFVDPANNGGLSEPRGLLFKPDGNLLVTSYGTHETLEFRRETGFPLGRWAKSGNFSGTRLNQESPWGLRIGPNGNVFIVRTGEAFGSDGSGNHDHGDGDHGGGLHLTNAQIYEFDVRNGNFLRSHINGNDHGMEFPSGFDFVPGSSNDCNNNQQPDNCDISGGTSSDVDSNGTPDECEIDCNSNGVQDRLDLIPFGTSTDCNANLIPDECDSASGTGGACEVTTEVSCSDGFDNDRDGLPDCADSDCDVTSACPGVIVGATTLNSGPELFSYVDDAFRGTAEPSYADGSHGATAGFEGDGGLVVSLGGIDNVQVLGMSGGWRRSFNLSTAELVTLSFRYRMEQAHGYESDEFSQVLVSVDGNLVGTLGNDYVVQLTGDGQGGVGQIKFAGWQQITLELGVLGAGAHSVTLGGYNNKKTQSNESTTIWFDDVGLTTVVAGPAVPASRISGLLLLGILLAVSLAVRLLRQT